MVTLTSAWYLVCPLGIVMPPCFWRASHPTLSSLSLVSQGLDELTVAIDAGLDPA